MTGKKYKVRRCQVWHMISLQGGSWRKYLSSSRWIGTVFIKAPLKLSGHLRILHSFFFLLLSNVHIQIYSVFTCTGLLCGLYTSIPLATLYTRTCTVAGQLFLMINQVISPRRRPPYSHYNQADAHILICHPFCGATTNFFRFVYFFLCAPCLCWYCSIFVSHRPNKHETLGKGGKKWKK
jgi:hypothetical protein